MDQSQKANKKYYRASHAAKLLGVCPKTLQRWSRQKSIEYILSPGGQRLYDADKYISDSTGGSARSADACGELAGRFKRKEEAGATAGQSRGPASGQEKAIYARVSSHKQKDDLQRQVQALQEAYPGHKVYQDICSGLNYKRRGLKRLLERVQAGDVSEVVVAHKDRLARL